MNEFLRSGQFDSIELNEQKKVRGMINERWDKLGLTAGLDGYIKDNIAALYENEVKYLLKEATASDNSGSFETVVFPIIRRVFSKLLANDIVSVQAMNLPIGKLFFIPGQSLSQYHSRIIGRMDNNGIYGLTNGQSLAGIQI